MPRISRGVCAFLLGALILFAPLAFGSVEPWAIIVLETAVFATGAIWLAGRAGSSRPRASTGLELPIVAFAGIVLLQLLPLPRPVLSILSPRPVSLYARTVPGYASGSEATFETWLLETDRARAEPAAHPAGAPAKPASYSPQETRDRLVLFTAFAVLFFVVADLARSRRFFRGLLVWIVFVGMAIAIQGIFQKLTWNGRILWFREPGPLTRPFGPFVNPNHFAAFMELVVPLSLGLLLTLLSRRAQFGYRLEAGSERWERRRPADGPSGSDSPVEEELPEDHRWSAPDPAIEERLPWTATAGAPKAVLLGFLLILSLGSIFLSLSRGGMMATALTFALFAPLLVPRGLRIRLRPGGLAIILAVAAIAFGVAFWFGASLLPERLSGLTTIGSEPSYLERLQAWKQTLALFVAHAPIGCGLGTFETAFAGYYPPGIYGIWKQAHNDYFQLLAETGIAGALPALFALYVFGRRHVFPSLLDRGGGDLYLVLGIAMAIVSMLFHSIVDFSLQIPAVGFLFVVMGGLLVGSATRRETESRNREERSSFPRARWLAIAGASLLLVLMAINGVAGVSRIRAGRSLTAGAAETDGAAALGLLEGAVRFAPARTEPHAALGDRCVEVFDTEFSGAIHRADEGRRTLEKGERAFRTVIQIKPLWAYGWWGIAQTRARLSALDRLQGNIDLGTLIPRSEEDLGREARIALAAVRTALLLEPNDFRLYDELAQTSLQEGLTAQAFDAYRESARLLPMYVQHYWGPVEELPEEVYRAISEGFDAAARAPGALAPEMIQRELGRMARVRGDLGGAEKRYRLALAASRLPFMSEVIAADLGEVLRLEGKTAEAIPILEEATRGSILGWAAWVSLSRIRFAAGDRDGAHSALTAAAAQGSDETWVQTVIAREMAAQGMRAAAIGRFQDILRRDPSRDVEREMLVGLLREEGRRAEALAEARKLRERYPNRVEYRDMESALSAPGD